MHPNYERVIRKGIPMGSKAFLSGENSPWLEACFLIARK